MDTSRTIAQTCPDCGEAVAAKVFGSYEDHPHDNLNFRYDAAICPKCDKAMLFVSEDYGQGLDDEKPHRLFPPQPGPLHAAIPEILRIDLDEARRCFKAKCYTATAIMVRRMTETLCAEHGKTTGSLFDKLKALKEKGVIEHRLFEWADLLRLFGNEGAHGGESITKDEAQEALAMAEALLDYVYSFQQRYNDFKKKIDERKKSQSA